MKPMERLRRLPDRAPALTDRLLEIAYLLLLAFYTLAAFRATTMLDTSILYFEYETARDMRIVNLLVVGARLARSRSWRPAEILMGLVLCGCLFRSWEHVYRNFVFELALLIAGARGMDFGKILRVHFAAAATALAVTVMLTQAGLIENLIYYRDDGTMRMSFGIIYPTDFAAQLFFLAVSWAWLRSARITWAELAAFVGLAVFSFAFCDARNNALCLVLLAAILAWLKLRRRAARGGEYTMLSGVQWLCVLAAPLGAAGMIGLSRLYDGSPLMESLNRLLSQRLYYGAEAFERFSVNLFGQEVELVGWGGTNIVGPVTSAFFLDSSYVNMLFCFGAVTLTAFLAAYVLSSRREQKNRSWERLALLALTALQCGMEHHFMELIYNPFLLLTLAASGPEVLPPPRRREGKHRAPPRRESGAPDTIS